MKINRAYSLIEFRSIDAEKRIIEGIATTPNLALDGMILETEGIQFNLPIPFLFRHNQAFPLGNVIKADVSKSGIRVTIQMAPAGVAEYIDEAWRIIQAGVVRGLSIAWRTLKESFDKTISGYRIHKSLWLELSAVPVPADQGANITSVRSVDTEILAALGHRDFTVVRLDTTPPGVSGSTQTPKGKTMTIQEQLAAMEAKRAAHTARMTEIMTKSADEGRTLEDAETQEYDGLDTEVKAIDAHLVRLRSHQEQVVVKATPVVAAQVVNAETASAARGGVVLVKGNNLPKGTAFTRYAIAMARSHGNLMQAAEISKQWKDSTPEVELVLRAAVAAGTTTATGWAAELAPYTNMSSEFIEFLRPQTIIGKINGFRRVPFNVKIPLADAGSSAQWVGQGARKPLSKMNFDTITLLFSKVASIIVLTEELVRFSSPNAEAIVRADMAAAIRQYLDEQFIDPSVAVDGAISPASITNGAANDAASGTTADDFRTDAKAALQSLLDANISPEGGVWVMQPTQAVALSMLLNPLGQPEFPSISAGGGTLIGYTVVTSNSVPSGDIVFFVPSEILLADDGTVTIDASREASLVMDDGGSPSVTTMVSLWQNNMVGLRAEQYINWKRRRDEAVYYITGANYGG